MRLELLNEARRYSGYDSPDALARRLNYVVGDQRDEIRKMVADYLMGCKRLLTFPSVKWHFEKMMVKSGYKGEFVGLEEDPKVMQAVNDNIVGSGKYQATLRGNYLGGIKKLFHSDKAYALNFSFDDFIAYYTNTNQRTHAMFGRFDGGWLDYDGGLSSETVNSLKWLPYLCDLDVECKFAITLCKRHDKATTDRFKSDGSLNQGMGSAVVRAIEGSGMVDASIVNLVPYTSKMAPMLLVFVKFKLRKDPAEIKPLKLDNVSLLHPILKNFKPSVAGKIVGMRSSEVASYLFKCRYLDEPRKPIDSKKVEFVRSGSKKGERRQNYARGDRTDTMLKVLKMHEQGLSYNAISKEVGIDRTTVSTMIRGIANVDKSVEPNNSRNPVDVSEYPNIMQRYSAGESAASIANHYRCDYKTIINIIDRSGGETRGAKKYQYYRSPEFQSKVDEYLGSHRAHYHHTRGMKINYAGLARHLGIAGSTLGYLVDTGVIKV